MGFVTNDPKKADEKTPGGHGLVVDLQLRVCPECRREVPEWQDECPRCGVAAVPQASLPPTMPDIPAHLLVDEDAEDAPEGGASADGSDGGSGAG
ncbi:hypothetical protein [Euzebya sp.]|uniref:hypothetical protein n=1 Tax=Euzebya sp. TaxID=1971409 RepID=UPI003511953C